MEISMGSPSPLLKVKKDPDCDQACRNKKYEEKETKRNQGK